MTVFLIILSFVLNIIALFSIILLFMRQNRLFHIEKKQENIMKEMEEIISSYILEMKEENENFIKKIKGVNGNINKEISTKNKILNTNLQKKSTPIQDPIHKMKGSTIQAARAYKQFYKEPITEILDDISLPIKVNNVNSIIKENKDEQLSMYDEVIQLHNNGEKVDDIAKKLNMGKTEIDLILKFREKI